MGVSVLVCVETLSTVTQLAAIRKSLLQLIAAHYDVVKNHFEQPAMKNCNYKFPKIQNDIIEIIGKDIIQKKILSEIKEARFFSILADEVTSHNKEELSLCIRFLDTADTIREEFWSS